MKIIIAFNCFSGSFESRMFKRAAFENIAPSNTKRRIQFFRKEYTVEFPFIKAGRTCESNAYCELCNCEFSIKHSGKFDVNRHIATQRHVDLSNCAKESKSISSFFASKSDSKTDNEVIRSEVMLVDLAVEMNIPLACLDKLTKAFKLMFKDSDVAQKFQCGRSKGTAIVKEIAAKNTTSLAARMRMFPFTISTDGSNDFGSNKLFPIVIRVLNPESSVIESELLSVPACETSATGETIFTLIDNEFKTHSVPWKHCISLGADNAPVMSGKEKGVYGYILKRNPNTFFSGCVCHLIHIAAEKGASSFPFSVDQLLINVFYYFKRSCVRQSNFKQIQNLHEITNSKLLKHVSTRWLSIKRCLPRLLENWEPLLDFFKYQEKHAKSVCEKQKADSLRKIFSSPTNRLICHFLVDALQPFDVINTELQSASPMVHVLRRRLEKLIKSLLIRFVKPSAMVNKDVLEVNIDVATNIKDSSEIHLGQSASDFIKRKEEVHLRQERLQEFFEAVKQFYVTSVKYLTNKLPLQHELLKHAEIVDTSLHDVADGKTSAIDYFAEKFPSIVPNNATVADIKLEYATYLITDITSCVRDRQDSTWSAIAELKEHEKIFKLLPQLMMSVLTIPHSSAHCERIFSIVRKNKTDARSSLSNDTLEALLIAKSRPENALDRNYTDFELRDLKTVYMKSLQKDN